MESKRALEFPSLAGIEGLFTKVFDGHFRLLPASIGLSLERTVMLGTELACSPNITQTSGLDEDI